MVTCKFNLSIFSSLIFRFFNILVSDSQQNINVLRGLAMQLQKIVSQENQKCWGKPLGSQSLWNGHLQTIQRIQEIASHVKISEVRIFQFEIIDDLLINFGSIFSLVPRFNRNYMNCPRNVFVR